MNFTNASIVDPLSFTGATFAGGVVSFDGARITDGSISFRGATFSGGTVDLSKIGSGAELILDGPAPAGLLLPEQHVARS